MTQHWSGAIDCVIVPPPSLSRAMQPAEAIARGIAKNLNVEYKADTVVKEVATLPMKSLHHRSARRSSTKPFSEGPRPYAICGS